MLQTLRRIVAAVVLLLTTLLFLDITGVIHLWFGWLAKIQLIPAILAVNVAVIVILALLTLLFGRIYCSVICPLGIMQDGISNISARRKGKKRRFHYSGAITWLRIGVLVLFIAGLVAGISIIVSLLDPYAAYGRIASSIIAPFYNLGNNLLAWFAEKANSYAFYSTQVWAKNWITLGVSFATLMIIGILAWKNGRIYCNSICPVGTTLGFLSKFSLIRPVFDKEKCSGCGLCEKGCKSSCIDSKNMKIDHSRCVVCFNCIENCKSGAITYSLRKKQSIAKGDLPTSENVDLSTSEVLSDKEGVSRRSFVTIAGMFAVAQTVKAQQLSVDGGLAEIVGKKRPDRKNPIVPPGAGSHRNIKQHCTACQLCISNCPNNVLRPSGNLATLMQPEMSFEQGYCRPECTECSNVCPTGAIKPISAADKSAISIGHAVWIKKNCVVHRDEVQCTACHNHCPTGAISLVPIDPNNRRSLRFPVVDQTRCIGCGACEHLCPARPFSAMYVEGNVTHHSY